MYNQFRHDTSIVNWSGFVRKQSWVTSNRNLALDRINATVLSMSEGKCKQQVNGKITQEVRNFWKESFRTES
jgi:hypothetical protein